MTRKSGVTSDTPDYIVFGPGLVTIDLGEAGERDLGMTAGGSVFNVNRNPRDIEGDGLLGPTKGMVRRGKVEATLMVRLKELTVDDIQMAFAGGDKTADTPAGYDTISGGEIASADYLTNVAITAEHSSFTNNVICILDNPLAIGDFNMGFDDEGEPVVEVTFRAHFTAGSTTEPWSIRWPKA